MPWSTGVGVLRMTIKEYADFQGVSKKTVERWIREGKLTYELTPSKRKRITGVKSVC